MTIYEFGIMDNRLSVEADDEDVAELAMALYLRVNVPIVVYGPEQKVINPSEKLELFSKKIDEELVAKIRSSLKTIKQLVVRG